MNSEQFAQLTAAGPILLDGATGTNLHAAGLPAGVCPETWTLENPTALQELQRAYYAAGSQLVYSFTFGANRPKLIQHHLDPDQTTELNTRLAQISVGVRDEFRRSNPGRGYYVAGDLAPTGRFLFPAGDLTPDALTAIYREQVRGQLQAGVDLFVAETMMDLAEARAAVFAVQAECDLPVMVSLTFEANGRTLAGNSPQECLLCLASLDVAAFGVNCSFGPEKLGGLIEPLRSWSPIPLLIKPNAGMPLVRDGKTVFPMGPAAFAAALRPLAGNGVQLLGGCCGTGPEHIAQVRAALDNTSRTGGVPAAKTSRTAELPRSISSSRQIWPADDLSGLPVVTCQDPDSLVDDVFEVMDDDPPAIILDLDAAGNGASGTDALLEALQQLQVMVSKPFVFRSENPDLLEKMIRIYNGRAGVITRQPGSYHGALIL